MQESSDSTSALARRYGLSRTTVAKWRKRTTTDDAPMGPHEPRSTALTPLEEVLVVAFRWLTLLSLDDVLDCLRDSIPRLTRSNLHRCLSRHGLSRLPKPDDATARRRRRAAGSTGCVHLHLRVLPLADGRRSVALAIDHVSKFIHVAVHAGPRPPAGREVLRTLVQAFPSAIHTIVTETPMPIARACAEHGVAHRQDGRTLPWPARQAERLDRTIEEALAGIDADTVKTHVLAFVARHNAERRLKALGAKAPVEAARSRG